MQSTRQSESVHSTSHPRDSTEQSSTNPRGISERRSTLLKQTSLNVKGRDAYVSEIINVQSLLNIRASESRQRKRNNSTSFQDRIIINICGDRYETHRTTLELYPDTLLGNRKQRKYYYDKTRHEYFFDRNRACFEAILYYYQSHGRLRRPNYIPIDIFLEEVTFFQLGEEALNQLREDENIKEVKKVRLPKNRFRRHLWATMEYPDYSIMAKVVNILSLLMILISTISLAVESLPQYESIIKLTCQRTQDLYDNSSVNASNNTNGTAQQLFYDAHICHSYFKSPFYIIQTVCVGFFTVELLFRIISAPSLIGLIKNFMIWIDIISVVPHYIALGIHLAGQQDKLDITSYIGLRLLRVLRFARVFKFYRVFKGVKSLRVLATTLKQSIPDFFIMIILLTLLSFLFGAAAYFAENDTNGQAFDSIFKATYWGVMTITSVGYGDIYPVTPIGRIIACLCALFGAATIAMLVSVLVDRYQRVFARKLYINEEIIDFDDYSDEENNDTDSRSCGSGQLRRRNNNKEIENPDARAKANAAFISNDHDPTDLSPIPDTAMIDETPLSRHSSRVHFIIGYVDDEKHETSRDLLETISTSVARKQTMGENIQLNIISDDDQAQSSPHNVKFRVSVSSEGDINEDDDDDDEELTEIVSGRGNKGNVLKKFQCPPSPKN